MKKKLNIIGIGEALYDMFPEGRQLGGAPINFAYHVKQLGANGQIISAVGRDDLGDDLLDEIRNLEITNHIHLSQNETGKVAVTLDEQGVPSYEICSPVAWDEIEITQSARQALSAADAICFGSLAQRNEHSKAAILRALEIVPNNCLKVFDINLRQDFYSKEVIEASLKQCNILKINEDEIVVIADMFGYKNMLEQRICDQLILDFDLEMVALTKGAEGSHLITKHASTYVATPKVEVVDTVGAGDSFTARLIIGLLNNEPLQSIHEKAVELSAFICTQKGATPKLTEELL